VIVCTSEDRPRDFVGTKLLLASLARACPDVSALVFCPQPLHSRLRAQVILPTTTVRERPVSNAGGWSVKPWLLLQLLDEGHSEIVWLDSDIIAVSDFRTDLRKMPADAMVVGGDPHSLVRVGNRVKSWGFQAGRALPIPVNSCVMRVTPAHRPILEHWKQLLSTRQYLEAQARPFQQRPPHLQTDQDALDALLSSESYKDVDVRFMRPGLEIAQCHLADGYTVRDRLRHLWRSLPPLVHSQGMKPWRTGRRREVFEDVSPYLLAAVRYRDDLGEETSWMDASRVGGKMLRYLSGGEPNLAGLLPALSRETQTALRIRTRLRQWLGQG
jgi:hypothetical protein